jgi:hypothetical protein
MPNKWTEGETLFAQYLTEQGIPFGYEQFEAGKCKPVDFTVQHPDCGTVLLEVKHIENQMPVGVRHIDFYKPIRAHIDAGKDKFREYKNRVCALVLFGAKGFVKFDANTVLGAMYGDFGWSIPFNPKLRHHDASQAEAQFISGRGRMFKKSGEVWNTRISALLTLPNYPVHSLARQRFIRTDDGRTRRERISDVFNEIVSFPEEYRLGVTVYENAFASNLLPRDLFRSVIHVKATRLLTLSDSALELQSHDFH